MAANFHRRYGIFIRSGDSLNVNKVQTSRSELFYWTAILFSNTLGTALGDFLTKPHEKGGLDFGTIGSSAVLASVLVVMIAGASYAQRRYGSINQTLQN